MARLQACLIDAYDTIVHTDFTASRDELPALAGLSAEAMRAEFVRVAPALSVGQVSMAQAFADILLARGVEPKPRLVRELAEKSRELLLASARLYDDVLPFLRRLRAHGIRTAIVSNCDENTRPMLAELGVAALADALILSNEVGAVKPGARIFTEALDRIRVGAEASLFVDNNAVYCAGASAVGIRALQMMRGEVDGEEAAHGFGVVRSLAEVAAVLEEAARSTGSG